MVIQNSMETYCYWGKYSNFHWMRERLNSTARSRATLNYLD